jgi:hypothetical protein
LSFDQVSSLRVVGPKLGSYPVAVIVPGATSNRLADLRPLVPKLLAAIERAQPGIAEFIGAD